jgi:5-formyltetrahydrofolate cyclo-ligase
MEHPPTPRKPDLRAAARAARAARSQAEREAFAQALAAVDLPVLADGGTVTLFVGVGDEPDTRPLIARLHARGVRVLLPIVMSDWSLDWAAYVGDDELAPAGYGLLEPTGPRLGAAAIAEADVVLVPALSVDPVGRRLGQGAGCYDRALTFVPPDTPILAVVFEDERISEDLPEEAHDRRVTGVIP